MKIGQQIIRRIILETKRLKAKEIKMLSSLEEKLNTVITEVQSLANSLITTELNKLATGLGIDLEKENWRYDSNEYMFTKVEDKKKEVTKTIPNGKKSKKEKK